MGILGIADLADFRAQIESSADVRKALAADFLVGVTEFFREPDCWDIVSESLMPELLARKGDAPLRVWVPACASGQEAYTLAMLLHERAPSAEVRAQIEIFATDIDRAALDIARAGIYTTSIAHALTPERVRRYFVQDGDSFQVKKELRSMILFSPTTCSPIRRFRAWIS
jgi:two-component system, chemotaxis family, CheB/CheR fusion protein